jgi:chitinase
MKKSLSIAIACFSSLLALGCGDSGASDDLAGCAPPAPTSDAGAAPSPRDASSGGNVQDASNATPGLDAEAPAATDGGGASSSSPAPNVDAAAPPMADAGAGAANPNPGPSPGPSPTPPGGKRIVGYYTSWSVYGRNFQPADVAANLLTHVNYAFANVNAQGQCVLGDPYADVDKFYPGDSWDTNALRGAIHQWHLVRQRSPHLKLMLSVGGWTWSRHFSDAALTPASRASFAQSCVALAARYGFDGLDIDWEYPVGGGDSSTISRPEDKRNFTLLLQALRTEATAQTARDGKTYLLSVALGGSPQLLGNLELAAAAQALDWLNLMTYDYHGGWEAQTGFNAPFAKGTGDTFVHADTWNVSAAVQYTLAQGVPAAKIQPGVPFYGRGWSGVGPANNGLYQPSSGLPAGSWEPGIFDYKDLVANYLPTMARYWDASAQVPYLYDPVRRLFISYDDPQSLRVKADQVNALGLGGIMFWELSGDTAQKHLLTALKERLNP